MAIIKGIFVKIPLIMAKNLKNFFKSFWVLRLFLRIGRRRLLKFHIYGEAPYKSYRLMK